MALLTGCGLDFKPKKTDAGVDGAASGGQSGGDSGSANDGPGGGGSRDGGGSDGGPKMSECSDDADCGDVERYRCSGAGMCEEHACHAAKACTGETVCEAHVCVPFVPPERLPAGYSQTSGGGSAASSQYRLRLSAGTPQPFGVASSSKYRVVLGPGAGRP